ncbi:MAG: MBL fold metallo-hydrolase [Pseudomonadota bacterium]
MGASGCEFIARITVLGWLCLGASLNTWSAQGAPCGQQAELALQVLGSGGPELDDGRASSSYLIWWQGRSVLMVDAGSGSSLRFEQAGASINDLDAVLFTHFHTDHSSDFAALVKGSYFSGRRKALPVYGPAGNARMPAASAFIAGLIGEQGIYPYLSDYLAADADQQRAAQGFLIKAVDVALEPIELTRVELTDGIEIAAIPVHHGPLPALAWRVDIAGSGLVFSGDTSNRGNALSRLSQGADVLVAHNAVPEGASGAARQLHMPPDEIGRVAAQSGVKQVVLSHRMQRTLGRTSETLGVIREFYAGDVAFADDLDCYPLPSSKHASD